MAAPMRMKAISLSTWQARAGQGRAAGGWVGDGMYTQLYCRHTVHTHMHAHMFSHVVQYTHDFMCSTTHTCFYV